MAIVMMMMVVMMMINKVKWMKIMLITIRQWQLDGNVSGMC